MAPSQTPDGPGGSDDIVVIASAPTDVLRQMQRKHSAFLVGATGMCLLFWAIPTTSPLLSLFRNLLFLSGAGVGLFSLAQVNGIVHELNQRKEALARREQILADWQREEEKRRIIDLASKKK
jgi:hypothetical protein